MHTLQARRSVQHSFLSVENHSNYATTGFASPATPDSASGLWKKNNNLSLTPIVRTGANVNKFVSI